MIVDLSDRKAMAQYLPKKKIGCEIGVKRGQNANLLLWNAKPKKLHLIDIWTAHPQAEQWAHHKQHVEALFQYEIEAGRVELHEGRSAVIMPTFEDCYFDWVYIDAHHGYESVKTDIELALAKLKSGGIIAGHDFRCSPYAYGTGVMRAVIEAIQDGRIRLLALTKEEKSDWVAQKL